ncbi:hypothetical protein Tco_1416590, partial [Tanacetum coccineum]
MMNPLSPVSSWVKGGNGFIESLMSSNMGGGSFLKLSLSEEGSQKDTEDETYRGEVGEGKSSVITEDPYSLGWNRWQQSHTQPAPSQSFMDVWLIVAINTNHFRPGHDFVLNTLFLEPEMESGSMDIGLLSCGICFKEWKGMGLEGKTELAWAVELAEQSVNDLITNVEASLEQFKSTTLTNQEETSNRIDRLQETVEKNKVEADRQFAKIMNAIKTQQPSTTTLPSNTTPPSTTTPPVILPPPTRPIPTPIYSNFSGVTQPL